MIAPLLDCGETRSGQRKRRFNRPPSFLFVFYSQLALYRRPMRWCTVTVTDQDGRRHRVDVEATSTFDAAQLFVVEVEKERAITPEIYTSPGMRVRRQPTSQKSRRGGRITQ